MSHIHIASMSAAIAKRLTRYCPECGAKQVVKKEQEKNAVPCSSCGYVIPPNGDAGASR